MARNTLIHKWMQKLEIWQESGTNFCIWSERLLLNRCILFLFLALTLENACVADELMKLKKITLSEWEIYFANKDKKQLGPNPIFKWGFELFDTELIPRGQAIALDIGCGIGFEAAWIL
jgi:hypothetical protein